jgi:hypothetical protein
MDFAMRENPAIPLASDAQDIDTAARPFNEGGNMNSTRNPGRVAGFWYLLLVLIGPLRLIYIPDKLFVRGNAAVTVSNIAANEWLFRFGIVSDLVGGVILIMLVLAFYRLFKTVDRNLAVMVVIFGGVMPALLDFVGAASDAATLMIAHGAQFLSVFDKPQQDALAMLFLKLGDEQTTAADMLWGIWLLPLALLVYRSRFLPRFLGVWLALNGVAYVILCLTGELLPQYQSDVFNYGQPAFFGELAIMLWLVIKGARPPVDSMDPSLAVGARA